MSLGSGEFTGGSVTVRLDEAILLDYVFLAAGASGPSDSAAAAAAAEAKESGQSLGISFKGESPGARDINEAIQTERPLSFRARVHLLEVP